MKGKLLSLAAVSVLVLAGCSQKNPDIDTTVNEPAVVETTEVAEPVQVQPDIGQIIANLKGQLGTVYFNFDQFGIRSDMQSVVSNDANIVNGQEAAQFSIKLEGNCDEWGTDEYNMALGLKRAVSVKNALASQGVDVNRIQTISYGKNNPVCSEKTKSCWAKNRRVDFDLLQ